MLHHNVTAPRRTERPRQGTLRVHFGGPDLAPKLLRALLEQHVEAVPPGGEIDWVTYYFRDRALARSLIQARQRGVHVRVAIEGRPRLADANEPVRRLLSGAGGIGPGFRAVKLPRLIAGFGPRGRLHAKIYCFSHPQPVAFIGSFNPSGDEPEDPAVIDRIGDQDRGHNLLVEIRDPVLVSALIRHARRIHDRAEAPLWRFDVKSRQSIEHAGTQIHFYPRRDYRNLFDRMNVLKCGDRLRIATSHMKGRAVLRLLRRLRKRGVAVSIVTHDTERRVPERAIRKLLEAGVEVRRCRDDTGLPMHNKFTLLEHGGCRSVCFGSLNLNMQSQLLNHEVLACSNDAGLFAAFSDRWDRIVEQASAS